MNPAAKLILQRLLLGVLTLLAVSMAIFAAVEFLPGDLAEATLGQEATEETIAAIRREPGAIALPSGEGERSGLRGEALSQDAHRDALRVASGPAG